MRSPRLVLPALLLTACAARPADLLPPDRPIPEVIDHYVDAKLKAAGVTPAAQADDATLVRRLTLDLVGRIPTAGRDRGLRRVDRPRQAGEAGRSADGLARRSSGTRPTSSTPCSIGRRPRRRSLREYLPAAFGENRPWDQVFRELLAGRRDGPEDARGRPSSSRRGVKDLDRLTSDVSSLFFGVNVSCAQCHDHPLRRRLEAGPLLRHEVVLRPHLRQRRVPRRARATASSSSRRPRARSSRPG